MDQKDIEQVTQAVTEGGKELLKQVRTELDEFKGGLKQSLAEEFGLKKVEAAAEPKAPAKAETEVDLTDVEAVKAHLAKLETQVDVSDPEALRKHLEKLEAVAAVDLSDPASVEVHLKKLRAAEKSAPSNQTPNRLQPFRQSMSTDEEDDAEVEKILMSRDPGHRVNGSTDVSVRDLVNALKKVN